MRAVRGRDHVVLLERAADADRDGLLADRDVEEAGQLAGAEALLDLLLEAPDQQHLAEELAQLLLGERPSLLPRLWPRAPVYAPRPWARRSVSPVERCSTCRARGRRRSFVVTCRRRATRRAPRRCSAREPAPGRSGDVLRFVDRARHRFVAGARRDGCSRRLDAERHRRHARARRLEEGDAGAAREAPAARRRLGRARSRRFPPTGATSTPRSSFDFHATTSSAAALLLAPTEPVARRRQLAGFRFRVARTFGYGASPLMARRCLERLDEEGIRGQRADPPRALRHEAGRHAGTGLARRRAGASDVATRPRG